MLGSVICAVLDHSVIGWVLGILSALGIGAIAIYRYLKADYPEY